MLQNTKRKNKHETLVRLRNGDDGGVGGGFDNGDTPLAPEEDPPPLVSLPDPLGALQP